VPEAQWREGANGRWTHTLNLPSDPEQCTSNDPRSVNKPQGGGLYHARDSKGDCDDNYDAGGGRTAGTGRDRDTVPGGRPCARRSSQSQPAEQSMVSATKPPITRAEGPADDHREARVEPRDESTTTAVLRLTADLCCVCDGQKRSSARCGRLNHQLPSDVYSVLLCSCGWEETGSSWAANGEGPEWPDKPMHRPAMEDTLLDANSQGRRTAGPGERERSLFISIFILLPAPVSDTVPCSPSARPILRSARTQERARAQGATRNMVYHDTSRRLKKNSACSPSP